MTRSKRIISSTLLAAVLCMFAFSASAMADPADGTVPADATFAETTTTDTTATDTTATDATATGTTSGVTEVTIDQLLASDISIDGTTVHFTGEAVGTPVVADSEHKWISVASDGSAVSVYMRNGEADTIKTFGKYGVTGDTLDVTGTFYIDCTTHESDVDVHAVTAFVSADGGAQEVEASPARVELAIVLLLLGAAAGIIFWRLYERQR